MMVSPGTGKIAMPPTPASQPLIQVSGPTPTPPPPSSPTPLHTPVMAMVPDLSASMPVDNWMADPDTDLLRRHRTRSLVTVVLVLVGLGIAVGGIVFAFGYMGGGDDTKSPNGGAPIDAGRVYTPPAPDAATEMSREQITALSKRGFYSLKSTEPAQIYIDDLLVGSVDKDTPLVELPVKPGVHKVKAVVKGKPPKEMKITIIGGRTTDDGTLSWDK